MRLSPVASFRCLLQVAAARRCSGARLRGRFGSCDSRSGFTGGKVGAAARCIGNLALGWLLPPCANIGFGLAARSTTSPVAILEWDDVFRSSFYFEAKDQIFENASQYRATELKTTSPVAILDWDVVFRSSFYFEAKDQIFENVSHY
ncbi:hypothetical protein ACP70R_044828 [Stipagrostis hirtigluma subsp. patula]